MHESQLLSSDRLIAGRFITKDMSTIHHPPSTIPHVHPHPRGTVNARASK